MESLLEHLVVKQTAQIGGDLTVTGQVRKLATPTAANLLADEVLNGVRTRWVKSSLGTLLTTGDADTDIATLDIPYAKWYFTGRAIVECVSASATVAASVLRLYSAAAAGGTALTAALTCTGMTAAGIYLPFVSSTLTAFLTTAQIHVRQTTDSGNAGTVRIYAEIVRID